MRRTVVRRTGSEAKGVRRTVARQKNETKKTKTNCRGTVVSIHSSGKSSQNQVQFTGSTLPRRHTRETIIWEIIKASEASRNFWHSNYVSGIIRTLLALPFGNFCGGRRPPWKILWGASRPSPPWSLRLCLPASPSFLSSSVQWPEGPFNHHEPTPFGVLAFLPINEVITNKK